MVEFENPEAAAHALERLQGLELWRNKLSVSYAPPTEKKESEATHPTAKPETVQTPRPEVVGGKDQPNIASASVVDQPKTPEAVKAGNSESGLNKRKRAHPIALELGYDETFL